MNFNIDDPKYTAYALGELPENERLEVEREIRGNPELAAAVEEIRLVAAEITKALAAEPEVSLDDQQRQRILKQSKQTPPPPKKFPAWLETRHLSQVAALFIVAAMLAFFGRAIIYEGPRQQAAIEVEMREVSIREIDEIPETPDPPEWFNTEVQVEVDIPDVDMDMAEVVVISIPDIGVAQETNYSLLATVPSDRRKREELARFSHERTAGARAAAPASSPAPRAGAVFAFKPDDAALRDESPAERQFLSPSIDDFGEIRDNPFKRVVDHPLSTFSVDVDTASYALVRRFLNEGRMPPRDAVRVEELVNYFPYEYAPPASDAAAPFAANLEVAPSPWAPERLLVRVALKGREIAPEARPPMRLVFLIDVSGSMSPANRLPLVIRSMRALAKQLDKRDQVAIVVYSGAAGMVLPPTSGTDQHQILESLDKLNAGGSTAGAAGIQLAYQVARGQFDKNAANRVVICTDGDFNVGVTSRGELESLIEREAKSGVFLTVLGFGMGNYKDSTLEVLSNKGNGNYAFIDDFNEARKVLVDQMLGTMVAIAKDVKVQVEFNPAAVAEYRLLGYENRLLRKEDFNNDKIDAGDIGAGHTVTAFYEVVPAGGRAVAAAPAVDPLRYGVAKPAAAPMSAAESADGAAAELLTVKLRYKQPDGEVSSKLEFPLAAATLETMDASREFRFAAAVAGFGQLLRGNQHVGDYTYAQALELAEGAVGDDPSGYRAEFLRLVRNAMAIAGK